MEFKCGFTPRKHPVFSSVEGTKLYCVESTKQNNCSKLNKQVSKNVSQTNHLLKIHHSFGLNVFCASTTGRGLNQKVNVICSQGFWQQSHAGVTLTLCAWPAENSESFLLWRETEAQTKSGIPAGLLQCLLTAWDALCSSASSTGMSPWQEQPPSNPRALHPTLHPRTNAHNSHTVLTSELKEHTHPI